MKRILLVILLALLLCGQARADESLLPPELEQASPRAAELMNESSEDNFGFAEGVSRLLQEAAQNIGTYISAGIKSLAAIMAGVVLLGLVEHMGGTYAARHTNLVGALYITAVSAGDLSTLIGLGRDTVEQVSALSKTLLPALAAATAASGSITSASVRQVTTVFFIDILLTVMDRVLLPMLYLYIAAAAANAVLDHDALSQIAAMIKKLIGWALTSLLAVFTAYLSISGAVAGVVDAQTVRIAKSAVNTVVPVVGGILSEAAETVLAGAQLMRSMIGVFGMLAVLSLCLLPFLRLGIQYLLYQLAVLIAQAAGPKKLAKMIGMLGDAFSLVLAMTGASALLLIISLVSTLTVVSA